MRVLLVFSSSELGGAERSLTRMALVPRDDVNFVLATLDGPGPWVEWCRSMGVEPLALGRRHATRGHGRFGIVALLRLVSLVRREGFAALYVIGLRASLLVRLVKPLLKGTRIVHGIRWNPDSTSRLDQAFRFTEHFLGGLIDLYICNSCVAAKTLQRRVGTSPRKVSVVYNGLARLPPERVKEQNCFPRVLSVANISPRKGYLEYLEEVVAPLSKYRPQARFVIVGRDEMAGTVQGKANALGLQEAVEFAGFLPDVSSELQAASLFVLPSLWNEGCPTSILEAMAHGLPVVAFAIDGIPELIDHNIDGILVPRGDYAGMKNSIKQLLDDPALSNKLGQAGRAKVAAKFGIKQTAEAHALTFKRLLMTEKNEKNRTAEG